jgi:hypothetical protein
MFDDRCVQIKRINEQRLMSWFAYIRGSLLMDLDWVNVG